MAELVPSVRCTYPGALTRYERCKRWDRDLDRCQPGPVAWPGPVPACCSGCRGRRRRRGEEEHLCPLPGASQLFRACSTPSAVWPKPNRFTGRCSPFRSACSVPTIHVAGTATQSRPESNSPWPPAGGEPLAPGVYRLTFRDKKSGLSCDSGPQLLVQRRPESELDGVEGRLTRYRYLETASDWAAALEQIAGACSENPEGLTAWHFLAGQAGQAGDREAPARSGRNAEPAAYDRRPKILADSTSVLELAPEAVRHLDQRRENFGPTKMEMVKSSSWSAQPTEMPP